MKAIFIAFNQAYNMEIADILEEFGCRGMTMWQDVCGRGTSTGEPHLGNHAWAMVPADKVDAILEALKAKDEDTPALGLRAYVWSVEKSY